MPDIPARESLPAPAPDDLARFGQFINWITVAVFAFGSLELLGAFIFQQPWIGVAGGLSLGYGACLLWARHLLRQGRLRAAVMLTSVGLLALLLVGTPVLPTIYAALLLLPFVVVALALPYMPGREMRWLILIAWLVGVLIAIIGSLAPSTLALPAGLAIGFRIAAVAAALGLAFLLLWQYAHRLNDTLAQSRAANRELQQQDEQLQGRLGQLSALRAIDVTISSSIDLRVTLAVVLEQVVSQLKVAAADILLFNPTLQNLEYALGRGFGASNFHDMRLPVSGTHAGQVVLERRVLILADMRAEAPPSWRTAQLVEAGFVSYAGAPLVAQGQMLGVLELFQRAPFQPDASWLEFLEALAGQAAIALDNSRMFDTLQQNNQELTVAYEHTIDGWSAALDLRDKETEGHSQRVTALTIQLAEALGFSPEQLVHVRRGALLHDIGKMGIPDAILLKPGPLTEDEWVIMRQHPLVAHQLLEPIEFLRPALEIPFCHHEHWDGTGYPRGLKGDQIPLAARLFAVVDVWDALRSDRPYRPAWPEARVLAYLHEQAGAHFDPQVVELFARMISGR
jgi:putative nucleotidyltransferase with HDIG domain